MAEGAMTKFEQWKKQRGVKNWRKAHRGQYIKRSRPEWWPEEVMQCSAFRKNLTNCWKRGTYYVSVHYSLYRVTVEEVLK
jgi:hypothetical protein